jgi:hypothetical protein
MAPLEDTTWNHWKDDMLNSMEKHMDYIDVDVDCMDVDMTLYK